MEIIISPAFKRPKRSASFKTPGISLKKSKRLTPLKSAILAASSANAKFIIEKTMQKIIIDAKANTKSHGEVDSSPNAFTTVAQDNKRINPTNNVKMFTSTTVRRLSQSSQKLFFIKKPYI